MNDQGKVRIAVIGAGIMGSSHIRELATRLPNTQLAAVCDIDREKADRYAAEYGVPAYYDHASLLAEAELEAVVIATPHYSHTPISIAALERGLHVLTEKPLAVHVQDGQKMIAAYARVRRKDPRRVFAIMFQQRTYGGWQKIKALIDGGELGRLVRATWLITDWFRPQSYYDGGGWRATWAGEGGGVLLNQCPHNLDLYQWFFGLPRRASGFASLGKYHRIEVEDEVTGYCEHENGMVGHFVTTTAESPGTNRLEVVGEKGRLVFEDGRLTFTRNQESMLDFIRTSPAYFDKVACRTEELPCPPSPDAGHALVLEAFARAIRGEGEPVAWAPEGLNSLMLGNAMLLSSFRRRPVDLPIDAGAYAGLLRRLVRASARRKETRK